MIDYEKIAEAAVIMADFASELRELCGRYSKKVKELVSEKCLTGIELVPRLLHPQYRFRPLIMALQNRK